MTAVFPIWGFAGFVESDEFGRFLTLN